MCSLFTFHTTIIPYISWIVYTFIKLTKCSQIFLINIVTFGYNLLY